MPRLSLWGAAWYKSFSGSIRTKQFGLLYSDYHVKQGQPEGYHGGRLDYVPLPFLGNVGFKDCSRSLSSSLCRTGDHHYYPYGLCTVKNRAILLGLSEPLLLLNFPLSAQGRKSPPVCGRHPWRHSVHCCCGPRTVVSPLLSLRITKFKATWAIKPSVYLSWVCVNVLQSTFWAKFQYEMLPYE